MLIWPASFFHGGCSQAFIVLEIAEAAVSPSILLSQFSEMISHPRSIWHRSREENKNVRKPS
jgi:hypothetical protein